MSNNNLTTPFFSTNPSSYLKLAEPETITTDDIINFGNENDYSLIPNSLLGSCKQKDFTDPPKEEVNFKGVLNAVADAYSELGNAINTLPLSAQTIFSNSPLTAKSNSPFNFITNGTSTTIPNSSFNAASDLQKLTNGLFNDNSSSLNNINYTGSVVGSMITNSSNMGIAGLSTSILNKVNEITGVSGGVVNPVIYEVAKTTLPTLINNSDSETIKTLNKLLGNNVLYSLNPNLIDDYGQCYKKNVEIAENDYGKCYKDTVELYDEVDPSWNKDYRAGQETIDLSKIVNASEELKKVLLYGSPDESPNKLASVCTKESVEDSLQKENPTVPVKKANKDKTGLYKNNPYFMTI